MKETDAQTITRGGVLPISKEFDSSEVLLSLGADGASVMSGYNEVVAAELEKTYPWLNTVAKKLRAVSTCDLVAPLIF